MTSIAIPAIGTGNLHFPRPEVAKVFFEEVTSFLTAHPQSAIDDVRFVAYGKDQATVDAFLGLLNITLCYVRRAFYKRAFSSCEKSISQCSAENRGFRPDILLQRKLTGCVS